MEEISAQLVRHLFDAIDREGLTMYGAAVLIASDEDSNPKNVHKRLVRYKKDPPRKLDLLIGMLAVFDLKVQVLVTRQIKESPDVAIVQLPDQLKTSL